MKKKQTNPFYHTHLFYFQTLHSLLQLTHKYPLFYNHPNPTHHLQITLTQTPLTFTHLQNQFTNHFQQVLPTHIQPLHIHL
ncbi:5-bromo-4-chloroindolyl phosphate hydrolysis family protein, partial [Bacillus pumilus]|uniref:5-bromo-4-chloroindolyl phosphate hydrolysis family protein n=1 Tax=Bacillus pumilus TaxID=1408 RepID=UPI0037040861